VLHDDNDFVVTASLATELNERNIHAGPAAADLSASPPPPGASTR
jgi:hypothetical protein